MGYDKNVYYDDPDDKDRPATLTDGLSILYPQIKKALEGEPFFYFDYNGTKYERIDCNGIEERDYIELFSFYYKCSAMGMPHGKGWGNELPWVSDLYMELKRVDSEVEIFNMKKNRQRGKNGDYKIIN